jgi:hypothetical protein
MVLIDLWIIGGRRGEDVSSSASRESLPSEGAQKR